MGITEQKLSSILTKAGEKPLYCYYSTDEHLLNSSAKKTLLFLSKDTDSEITQIEGPVPSFEEIVAAAGTISFFGTKRIVNISLAEPSAIPQADIDALCDLVKSLENANIVLTCLLKDEKGKSGKKAKQIFELASKYGICEEINKLTDSELKAAAKSKAEELGAELTIQNASLIVERCKSDILVIENETAKLAALANYKEITADMIMQASTLNIEADVFEMVRYVSAKNKAKAFELLNKLLQLQNEPVAIAAALAGSFIDVYRVKCAAGKGKGYSTVFKEFHYHGSDYRLKKAEETAMKYSKCQLCKILEILLELDLQLKSSVVDNVLLLQTAICEIIDTGASK